MDQARPSRELSPPPTMLSRFPQIGRPVPLMNPIRRRPCADPGQKQVPGEWMTQKGIDSSKPVTEDARVRHIEPQAGFENTQAPGRAHAPVWVRHRDRSASPLEQCADATRCKYEHNCRHIQNRK